MEMWIDQIHEFRKMIHGRISRPPTDYEKWIDPTLTDVDFLEILFETFRIFGFLDCTDFRTTRPGSGPMPDGNRRPFAFEIQRELYSKYFRAFGLKYLSILLPNGMTAAVFGSTLSTADNGLINMSNLSAYLLSLLQILLPSGLYPSLYGDAIIQLTPVLQSCQKNPNNRQLVWNKRMSAVRQAIELDYGMLFNLFRIMIHGEELLHVYNNGEEVFRLGIVCFFLKNCYICFNGSPTNSIFESSPPSLEEYLPLDEELEIYERVVLNGKNNNGN